MIKENTTEEYTVTWTIQLDAKAKSPREAALRALKIQRDKESEAVCFKVTDSQGREHEIDFLNEIDCLDSELESLQTSI